MMSMLEVRLNLGHILG